MAQNKTSSSFGSEEFKIKNTFLDFGPVSDMTSGVQSGLTGEPFSSELGGEPFSGDMANFVPIEHEILRATTAPVRPKKLGMGSPGAMMDGESGISSGIQSQLVDELGHPVSADNYILGIEKYVSAGQSSGTGQTSTSGGSKGTGNSKKSGANGGMDATPGNNSTTNSTPQVNNNSGSPDPQALLI
jgi:hypothetical protein